MPDHVSESLIQCIEFLDANYIDEEGLYRLSGSFSTINDFKALLMRGNALPFDTVQNPHDVSCAIKQVLQKEFEPV